MKYFTKRIYILIVFSLWIFSSCVKDVVPIPDKIHQAQIEVESIDTFSEGFNYIHFNTRIKVSKLIKYPYNTVWIYLYIGDTIKQLYYFLKSKSNFVDCDNCYKLLDSPCITNLGGNNYELNNTISDYDADYYPKDIDSVKFIFATFSALSEKLCTNSTSYEELRNNPLPFVSNPSLISLILKVAMEYLYWQVLIV